MTRYTVYHHETKYGSHTIWRDAWNELKERTGNDIIYPIGQTGPDPMPFKYRYPTQEWTYPDGWQIRREQANG